MKAFVTGGSGFVGSHLIRRLRERGDDVTALARSAAAAQRLGIAGCRVVIGDVTDGLALRTGLEGADAVFHVGGVYRVGIRAGERPAMYEANVRGSAAVLDAAVAAAVPRIVYVSTAGVFGNTHGVVVDEDYVRPPGEFLSYYDETKYLAHLIALDRIAHGAPVLIAQPGGIYGPGDRSDLATQFHALIAGRLPAIAMGGLGISLAHVDDVADGLVRVCDRGQIGRSYLLSGENTTLATALTTLAEVAGRKPPAFTVPDWVVRAAIPLGPLISRVSGYPPNMKEAVRTAMGVTFWVSNERARRELGWAPRDLRAGLAAMLAAGEA